MAVLKPDRGVGGTRATISGQAWDVTCSCDTAAGTTEAMQIEGLALGSFRVPNGSSITTVTWYAAKDPSDTPVALKDADGVAVSQTVAADEAHAVPSAVAGCAVVAPVTNAAGDLYFHWER